jgi:hypothetical protein
MKHHAPYKPLPPGWNRPVYVVTFYFINSPTETTVKFDRKYAAIEAARAFVKAHLEEDDALTYRGIDNGFQVCQGRILVARATVKQTKKAKPALKNN